MPGFPLTGFLVQPKIITIMKFRPDDPMVQITMLMSMNMEMSSRVWMAR